MELFRIKKDIPFMRHALVLNAVSLITFLAAVFFLFSRGLNLSVEFTGGTVMEVAYEQPADLESVRKVVTQLGYADVPVQNFGSSRDVLLRLGRFFAHESCGKCYPCQLGTQRQYEILQRVAASQVQAGDRERLTDVGWTMSDASICGLGQSASWAVQSAMRVWPELFNHG